jgi:methionyl-tRNA formyltransferase
MKARLCAELKNEDGLQDFNQNADALERKIRAYTPWPGAYFLYGGQPLKVKQASVALDESLIAGETGIINQLPAVGTGKGALILQEVQPAGKKMMSGKDFLRGARDWVSA